jgi:subtilisin family serine protease
MRIPHLTLVHIPALSRRSLLIATLALGIATSLSAAELRVPCDKPIKNEYIVVLKGTSFRPKGAPVQQGPALEELSQTLTALHGGKAGFHYRNDGAPGFSLTIDELGAKRLAGDPRVEIVEQACPIEFMSSQGSAPWGLDRVDQMLRPLNTTYTYNETGAGVNVYIIDTGISPSASQFGARLKTGMNFHPTFPATDTTDCYSGTYTDGHGTAVAAVVGGTTYGTAKGVNLYPLRIADCSGGTSVHAKAAVDWMIANRVNPAIANISWQFIKGTTLDTSIQTAINAGITIVAAANNSGVDACGQSPSGIADVVTVGAVDANDVRATFPWGSRSNYGTCVDLWAPGRDIASLTKSGVAGTFHGTSFAAPHVAGAAANYLQSNPTASPATVASYLTSQATASILADLGAGSPNLLLFAKPAHACLTWSCNTSTFTCSFDVTCTRMPFELGYVNLDFGDGQSYYGGQTTFTHTYATGGDHNISMTLLPWQALSDATATCVRVSTWGTCKTNGTYPWK